MSTTEASDAAEQVRVQARVSDPDLVRAINDATSDLSMADVVRDALRNELLDGETDTTGEVPGGLAGRGYRCLAEAVDQNGGMIAVSAAESLVASECNIKKDTVRSTVFRPLKKEGLIGLSQHVNAVFIVVKVAEEGQ
ncbi:hypothetical protein [Haladaptatus sp. DYF46]|uniref:hypothetical protein n=1 Tax=Haladaptatus sp. DYF46 TaxID=2886041 RepID=UPI001E4F5C1F|nr:hypothetical protein [Haladaptatus sp. DYF46]